MPPQVYGRGACGIQVSFKESIGSLKPMRCRLDDRNEEPAVSLVRVKRSFVASREQGRARTDASCNGCCSFCVLSSEQSGTRSTSLVEAQPDEIELEWSHPDQQVLFFKMPRMNFSKSAGLVLFPWHEKIAHAHVRYIHVSEL